MKILVTGANGYIGLHIVKTLLDKGIQVIACDLNTDEVDKRAERKNIDLFTLPDTNIYTLLGTPDVCLHLAWRNGFVHNASTHLGDLSAHYRFLTRIIDDGLPQLAVMGTMHEIGYWEGAIDENTPCNPLSMYGIAKDALRRCMIQYTQQKGCILQWLRGYYILGDDKKNNSIFLQVTPRGRRRKRNISFHYGKKQIRLYYRGQVGGNNQCRHYATRSYRYHKLLHRSAHKPGRARRTIHPRTWFENQIGIRCISRPSLRFTLHLWESE